MHKLDRMCFSLPPRGILDNTRCDRSVKLTDRWPLRKYVSSNVGHNTHTIEVFQLSEPVQLATTKRKNTEILLESA